MSLLIVDHDKCNHDGLCAQVCPMRIIDFEPGADPRPAPEAEEICITCGHCVAVCPTGAMSHRGMDVRDCPEINPELAVGRDQMIQLVRSRRSIRTYRPEPVGREALAALIDLARYAPTGHNTQPVHYLVFESPEEVHRLAELTIDWVRGLEEKQPRLFADLHMDRLLARWDMGEDRICRSAPHVIFAHGDSALGSTMSSCYIALTTMELAAPTMGLGACWAGYLNRAFNEHQPARDHLNLPPGHVPIGALMIGRPKYKYHRLPQRNEPPVTWR